MSTTRDRKPYVNPLVPTRVIDRKLGRVNVGTPDAEVEQIIREAIDSAVNGPEGGKWTAAIQRQTVRYAIWRHHRNLAEYAWVMGSH